MLTVTTQKYIPIIQNFLSSQPVKRAYLFGSCSRGEETPDSDIDLLVSYDYSKKNISFQNWCYDCFLARYVASSSRFGRRR